VKAYLNALNDRERWMLVAAVLFLTLYCYYLFLYEPLNQKVNQKSKQLIENLTTLEWMNQIKTQSHIRHAKQQVDNSQLLTLLAKQLKDNETLKFPYQLQQTGTGDIQLTFNEVPFNLFVEWFEKLNLRYTIYVKQFEVERSAIPGITRLMIVISATT